MKPIKFLSCLLLPLVLSSCHFQFHFSAPTTTVVWGDTTTVVPWYVVGIPVLVVTAVILLATHFYFTGKLYRCPACGWVFKPRRREISVWLSQNHEHVVQCPNCGRKGFCPRQE